VNGYRTKERSNEIEGAAMDLAGRTSRSETINHGVAPAPGNTIPEGSQAMCPGVPAGIALIPNLRTGWAMAQPQSATIRLLFSDLPLACQDLGVEGIGKIALERCVNAWSFSMTLPPEMQMPGVYSLPDHKGDYEMSFAAIEPSQGCGGACSGGGGFGGSGPNGPGPQGTLEIYSVTDQCITGRLQGLTTGQVAPPPPSLDGAFHAVRCAPTAAAAGDP
jgi:hypothetical protein